MTKQFKAGDKVRVVGSPDGNHRKWDYTENFDNSWVSFMDKFVGKIFPVNKDSNGQGVHIVYFNGDGYCFPPEALELVESQEGKTQEQTFTLAEIQKAWENLEWQESSFDMLKSQLLHFKDPEYEDYLRLKEKFE